jgi:hypothetical protein
MMMPLYGPALHRVAQRAHASAPIDAMPGET